MATHVITRRIQYIIQYIYDAHFPSKSKILSVLRDNDFNISPRTFDRDLERIRADFGLEILYNKMEDGYYINEDKSIKVSSFFKFLEIVTLADIFSESLKDSNKILKDVSFDDSKSFKGIEHLKTILIAINQQKKILFIHENFKYKTFKNYEITPLLLKEYENRWYVIGIPEGMQEIRTFGIDRLIDIQLGGFSTIQKNDFEQQLSVFDSIVGLDYKYNTPKKIRLLVNELHINYMKSLPIHQSQFIHPENMEGNHFVDFFLIPNYEFKSQILKMGSNAFVVSPKSFKEELKAELRKTLKQY